MKNILKALKWLGLTVLSFLLIVVVYLAITGFPKPFSITTENVPRLSFSYISEINDAADDFSKYLRLVDWKNDNEEGVFVRFIGGAGLKIGLLDKDNQQPKVMDGWPKEIPLFHPDPEKQFFLYHRDNSGGNETYQIYRFDLDSQKSTMLTNGKDPHSRPEFIPGTDQIIYARRNVEDTRYNLFIKDLNDPTTEQLVFENNNPDYGEGILYIDDFSPDGTKVVLRLGYYTTIPGILDLKTGELTILKEEGEPNSNNTSHTWSADGERLYYASSKKADFSQLRVRDLKTGVDSTLVKGVPWDVSNVSESPDGKWLVYNINEDGIARLHFYHLPTGTTKKFDKLSAGSIAYAIFQPGADATVAFPLTYFSGETDIFSYNLETERLKQWTDNKQVSDFPDPQVIQYETFDLDSLTGEQRKISAVCYKPIGEFDEPYPVVIELHGGPNLQVRTGFNPVVRANLSRGIATIAPNYRGSRGYGYTFMNLDYGKGREGAIRDIGALLDWIEKQPEFDANRVIVSGASYGGFLSLACATRYSDRLTGAIDYLGYSDLVVALEGEKNADRTLEFGDVNDPEMRAFLKNISPINNVENIEIPIFIFQGEKDARVLVDQSRNMVEALKKSNKEYWYLEAENEGHEPTNPWNIIFTKTAEFTFVDELFFGQ